MNLKIRIRRLEERRGLHRTTPPISFFDRVLDGTVTQAESQRWLPWMSAHFAKTADSVLAGQSAPLTVRTPLTNKG